MQRPDVETFHWSTLGECLGQLANEHNFSVDAAGRWFVADRVRVVPPPVVPVPDALLSTGPGPSETARERAARLSRQRRGTSGAGPTANPLARYLQSAPTALPNQCLIALQAGASALGYFRDGEVVATKTFRKYVVRGKGRAQPTHLDAKGKSRYGSRLRLQNARQLIDDTNRKLTQYWTEFGAPEHIFVSAPSRLWSDLFGGQVPPPFARSARIHGIPLDLDVPRTDVLLRAYRSLCYGRIERTA